MEMMSVKESDRLLSDTDESYSVEIKAGKSADGRTVAHTINNATAITSNFSTGNTSQYQSTLSEHNITKSGTQLPLEIDFRPEDTSDFCAENINTFSPEDLIDCFWKLKKTSAGYSFFFKLKNIFLHRNSTVTINQCADAAKDKFNDIFQKAEPLSGKIEFKWNLSDYETASQALILGLNLAMLVNDSMAFNVKNSELEIMLKALWLEFANQHGGKAAKDLLDEQTMHKICGETNDNLVKHIISGVVGKLSNIALYPEFCRQLKRNRSFKDGYKN